MPAIVDHDEMRMQILEAFQRCITAKPITQISLRDIAAEAGMSHAKLLYYFKNKDELIISYVKYTKDYMTGKCVAWFKGHPRAEYESNLAYMNAFMEYVAAGQAGEVRPNATTQTYVLQPGDRGAGKGGVSGMAHDNGAVPCRYLRAGGRRGGGRGDDDTHRGHLHLQLQQGADRPDKRQHHWLSLQPQQELTGGYPY